MFNTNVIIVCRILRYSVMVSRKVFNTKSPYKEKNSTQCFKDPDMRRKDSSKKY